MTRATWEDLSKADQELANGYLCLELSPEEHAVADARMWRKGPFHDVVAPLVEVHTMPGAFGEPLEISQGDSSSKEARQAEWDSLLEEVGMKPVPIDEILNGVDATPRPAGVRMTLPRIRMPRTRMRRVALLFGIGLPAAWGGAKIQAMREAWTYAVADYRAGRALAPGASFTRPTIYQTALGQEQWVALPTADVHLNSASRLSIGWQNLGAIDGEADVIVHAGEKLGLWVGDVPFAFTAGRYRVVHPLGPKARIDVVSGMVQHRFDKYGAGTEITAESIETQTTITARDPDGTRRPPVTLTNNAIRP